MPKLTARARRALVDERQNQILTAAARVFARKGFERATISEIAREAGVSEGSIYNYFKNKADLLVHIPHMLVEPAVGSFGLEEGAAGAGGQDAEAVLTRVAQQMVHIVTQNGDLLRVLFTSVPVMQRDVRQKYLDLVPQYAFDSLESFIREEKRRGTFRRDLDLTIAARSFPGMLFAFLLIDQLLLPESTTERDYDAVIRGVVRIFLHGVTTCEKPGKHR